MQIVHDPENQTFETMIDGKRSHLDYEIQMGKENKKILFTHTYCAPEHRGQGVAAALVKEGLTYARQNGYEVIALCSYVAAYLERHPQKGDE